MEKALVNELDLSKKKISIDLAGIESLKVEILETAKSCNDDLSKIKNIVEKTTEFYQCENGNIFRNKFKEAQNMFPIVISNIENIARDLMKAKKSFISQTDSIIENLSIAESNIDIK